MGVKFNREVALQIEKMSSQSEEKDKKLTFSDGDFVYRFTLKGRVLFAEITRALTKPADFELLNRLNLESPCGTHTVNEGVYGYTLIVQADGSGYEGSRTAEDIVCLAEAEAKKGYATLDVMTAVRAKKFDEISRKKFRDPN